MQFCFYVFPCGQCPAQAVRPAIRPGLVSAPDPGASTRGVQLLWISIGCIYKLSSRNGEVASNVLLHRPPSVDIVISRTLVVH